MPIDIYNPGRFQNAPRTGGLDMDFVEVDVRGGNSPREVFTWETTQATRMLRVAWEYRIAAAQQLLGYSTYDENDDGLLTRYLPAVHPEMPWACAVKVQTKGLAPRKIPSGALEVNDPIQYEVFSGEKIAVYEYAILTVDYDTPNFTLLADNQIATETDRYVEVEWKPNADYLSLPTPGIFKWTAGANEGSTFIGQVGKIVGTMDIRLIWHQVPYNAIPIAEIWERLGTINKTTFLNADPHTLLLTGADLKRIKTPTGYFAWTLSYTMKYNALTHNAFYDFHSTPIEAYQITLDGTPIAPGFLDDGSAPFNEREFSSLFRGPGGL